MKYYDKTPSGQVDCAMIGAAAYQMLAKTKGVELFAISMKDLEDQKEKENEPSTDPKTVLPEEYHDLIDVFSKVAANKLPPHRPYDHEIILEEGKTHGHSALRNMSQAELEFSYKISY